MSRGLDFPKASPESVASSIFAGLENGEEDIFPDRMAAPVAPGWQEGISKALERQFAAFLPQTAA